MDEIPIADYGEWLSSLKQRIRSAQQRDALAVNSELVLLYWKIGREILERQRAMKWGSKIIDRLSSDLRTGFPQVIGFSPRNLKYMRAFVEAWPDEQFVQAVLAQLPWYQQLALLDKLKVREDLAWYATKSIENGWSRNVLVMQIETRLRERQGHAVTNFAARLPGVHSDLAKDTLKDPYIFDFLGLGESSQERDVEKALIQHITRFLLELGASFAFVGRQYRLEIAGD